MTNLKIPSALLISGILVGLGLLVWYWPQLPENIATHFDEHGLPNGLLSKPTAVMLSAGLVTLLPLFFVGISVVIRWMPTSTINLPNREYWLAPERRDAAMDDWLDVMVFGGHHDLHGRSQSPDVHRQPRRSNSQDVLVLVSPRRVPTHHLLPHCGHAPSFFESTN
ncbi:MAG: DUF1648 domain-containing protein [Pirellulaceae bacterium]|nr:DUF1648 domain-containing protein [Pirellulaceae bacterium]